MKEMVVAGIPRCGTTYVFNSIRGLPNDHPVPYSSPVVKTHGLCPPETMGVPQAYNTKRVMDAGGKAIFVFGDIENAVISATIRQYNRWEKTPQYCGFKGRPEDVSFVSRDDYNFERMFDSWMNSKRPNILRVRYEALPQLLGKIDEFLGFEVTWLPWRERMAKTAKVHDQIRATIRRTYKSLIAKVKAAPDLLIT